MSNDTVKYIDFGETSARHFWEENVVAAWETFRARPNRANAIMASLVAWHMHEWVWHEHHPGVKMRSNPEYSAFKDDLFRDCCELEWIRDVADAAKHRGLGRGKIRVQRVAQSTYGIGPLGTYPLGTIPLATVVVKSTPLFIHLDDGRKVEFEKALSRVIDYWRKKYFS